MCKEKTTCQYCGKKVNHQGLDEHQVSSKRCWSARHAPLLDNPGSTMVVICLCGCGKKKTIRKADFKRGWGMFFSKSCKAKYQERTTGQYNAYMRGLGITHAAKRRGECAVRALGERVSPTVDGIEVDEHHHGFTDQDHDEACISAELVWDGHKDAF